MLLTDLSNWLTQLGYDYHRIVPSVDFATGIVRQPPLSSEMTVQRPPAVSVASLVECAFRRAAADITRVSAVRRSKVVSPTDFAVLPSSSSSAVTDRSSSNPVSSLSGLFGRGVLVSELGDGGTVVIGILDSAVESGLALVATTFLNTSSAVPMVFTVNGRDIHHFVHARGDRSIDDLRDLGLRPDVGATVSGVNITVHRHRRPPVAASESTGGEEVIEVRLLSERTMISVRYGVTLAAETDRVMRKAGLRAADLAWKIERERAQSGKRSLNTWTKRQVDELLSRGIVTGVHPVYIRSVVEFPKLADDPNNIRFVPSTN